MGEGDHVEDVHGRLIVKAYLLSVNTYEQKQLVFLHLLLINRSFVFQCVNGEKCNFDHDFTSNSALLNLEFPYYQNPLPADSFSKYKTKLK